MGSIGCRLPYPGWNQTTVSTFVAAGNQAPANGMMPLLPGAAPDIRPKGDRPFKQHQGAQSRRRRRPMLPDMKREE